MADIFWTQATPQVAPSARGSAFLPARITGDAPDGSQDGFAQIPLASISSTDVVSVSFTIQAAFSPSEAIKLEGLPFAVSIPHDFTASFAALDQVAAPASAVVIGIGYRVAGVYAQLGTLTVGTDRSLVWAMTAAGPGVIPAYALPTLLGPATAVPSLTDLSLTIAAMRVA